MSEERVVDETIGLLDAVDETEEIEETEDSGLRAPEGEDGQRDADESAELPDVGQEQAQEAPQRQDDRLRHRGRNADHRFQRLSDETRQLRERNQALEAQITAFLNQQTTAQRQQQENEFLQQLQTLPPDQFGQAILNRVRSETQQQVQQTRAQLWEDNDRNSFELFLNSNPRLQQFRDAVEQTRSRAPGVARVDLLKHQIGEFVLQRLQGAGGRQRTRAALAALGNQTRPPDAGRGSEAPRRERVGRTPAERLAGVPI